MKKLYRKYNFKIVFLLTFVAFFIGFKLQDSDYFFKINKSIEIFGNVYKEIAFNYVDEVDPETLMKAGIEGMLKTLDPYTNFITSSEASDVELITSGKYGGIGITISLRDSMIIITSLMEGYSAQRQGLRIGDQIIEIDGRSLIGAKPESVRNLTRGEPGTEVRLKIKREGEPKPLEFVLIREEIKLKNITYSGYLKNGIAIIKLERFTRNAGEELRIAIKELKLKGDLKGLILDLRDNPGGLLESAVDVVSKFVPKNSPIVSTKGRKIQNEIKYNSLEEPILENIPLAVLVNNNSASASEIVAGAIQDLDRGIIVGTKTFGKGLVQNVFQLPYQSQLKITTAKYYTPSGRCIQEIEYTHQGEAATLTPDSLKKIFYTKNGRPVKELGGIEPDTVVKTRDLNPLFTELLRKAMFFKFATNYTLKYKEPPEDFSINGTLCSEFRKFLDSNKFDYESDAEKKLEELTSLTDNYPNKEDIAVDLNNLKVKLQGAKQTIFISNHKEIARMLRQEIMSRYKGELGRIEASYTDDDVVTTAFNIISNESVYKKLLGLKNLN